MTVRVARIDYDGGVACERCVVADSFWLRFRGLMGRAEIEAGEGMLFVGTGSIQMTFMRFPIDAVFLDRELAVLGVAENVRPWRFAGRRGAKHVLELRAGEARRRRLKAGTRLRLIEPATAPAPTVPAVPAAHASSIHVLLGASDRRFLRVASFLLGRNGFSVASATRFADFMRAIERSEPDVVVLDASPPARWTTRAAVALQGAPAEVQVLLLTDEPTSGIPHVLPKWGSFDRLTDEIRRVHGRDLTDALPA
jgi:uncharacterized membrane protein (UPF0127 family)